MINWNSICQITFLCMVVFEVSKLLLREVSSRPEVLGSEGQLGLCLSVPLMVRLVTSLLPWSYSEGWAVDEESAHSVAFTGVYGRKPSWSRATCFVIFFLRMKRKKLINNVHDLPHGELWCRSKSLPSKSLQSTKNSSRTPLRLAFRK